MPRRKKCRWVYFEFEPKNGEVELSADEIEAIRLADVEGLTQVEAAQLMGISQPTFHRILREARKKLGIAAIFGMKIKIVGREYTIGKYRCLDCSYEWEEPFKLETRCPRCDSEKVGLGWGGRRRRRRGGH